MDNGKKCPACMGDGYIEGCDAHPSITCMHCGGSGYEPEPPERIDTCAVSGLPIYAGDAYVIDPECGYILKSEL